MNADLPRLLRAAATGTDHQASKLDVILTAAADEIDYLKQELDDARLLLSVFMQSSQP